MTQPPSTADDILPTYDRVADRFARERMTDLFEQGWLDRFRAALPGASVLDIGCGPGVPIARYLLEQGLTVTGVDGAPAMVKLFARNLPGAQTRCQDMRQLDMGHRYDGLLAWNSFFHLSPDAQRAMFPRFATHARPGAALMFTSGPAAGEVWGEAGGAPVYHASLSPQDYTKLLEDNGFKVLAFVPEDPDCNGHCIWLARFTA